MKSIKLIAVTTAIFLLAAGCNKTAQQANNLNSNSFQQSNSNSGQSSGSTNNAKTKQIVAPISRASERVTKKPFGIYITPKTSPVQPEKFTGYHSGVDFETFPEEKNADVAVMAICNGKIAQARTASGYGGVITEYCTINGEKITVIYGHVRIASTQVKAGQEVKAGEQIAVLGTGYSSETDGERKHLHLGIEKGWTSDIRGYVQQQSQLSSFEDVTKLF